jgi:hypothetical protein
MLLFSDLLIREPESISSVHSLLCVMVNWKQTFSPLEIGKLTRAQGIPWKVDEKLRVFIESESSLPSSHKRAIRRYRDQLNAIHTFTLHFSNIHVNPLKLEIHLNSI